MSFQEVYLTECSGTLGSDWWTDIKVFTYYEINCANDMNQTCY